MKRLHEKVNIVPVIAKADTLTPTEIRKLKDRVNMRNMVFLWAVISLIA